MSQALLEPEDAGAPQVAEPAAFDLWGRGPTPLGSAGPDSRRNRRREGFVFLVARQYRLESGTARLVVPCRGIGWRDPRRGPTRVQSRATKCSRFPTVFRPEPGVVTGEPECARPRG